MSLRDEQLYLTYLSIPERTIPKLAELTGMKADNLYKISKKNNWRERAVIDDAAIKQRFDSQDISELSASEILSGISRKSLEKLDKVISTVKVSTVRDAKTLLELSQLAAGKPTEITQTNSETGNDEATGQGLMVIFKHCVRDIPDEYANLILERLDEILMEKFFNDE